MAPANKAIPFEEARLIARNLGIKSYKEWREFRLKPDFKKLGIVGHPQEAYKNLGWISYSDWLDTTFKIKANYLSFEEARSIVRILNIKNNRGWRKFRNSDAFGMLNIPGSPEQTYKNKGWISYGDWLGTGSVSSHYNNYLSFEEAKKIASGLGIKGVKEWVEFKKTDKFKKLNKIGFPVTPYSSYKNEWKGMEYFFNYKRSRLRYRKIFTSFKIARSIVSKLGIKNQMEYRKFTKTKEFALLNIPTAPEIIYKNKGWVSYGHWLGTGAKASHKNFKFLSFNDAKQIIKLYKLNSIKDWMKHRETAEFIKNNEAELKMPLCPQKVYKNKGWKGWGDFLRH